uniref:Ig-like domain-containing protein n=1 Tax=Laticauda laticaudata TaxID=8630 RepID=A0A8C5RYF5_LATLA
MLFYLRLFISLPLSLFFLSILISIEVDPLNPMETNEVLMSPPIPSDKIKFCSWYRQQKGGEIEEIVTVYPKGGENIPGTGFDERITVYSNCTLHIKELTKDDSADYVLVEGGVGFSNVGNVTINVVEGKNTSLHCTAEGDNVVYFWTKEDQSVNENERIILTSDGQTLNFNPCDRSDAANYKCHASNSFSSGDSDPFGLVIIYGPDPPFINETIDLIEETISLTCVAAAYPATQNEWYYNGQLVENSPVVLTRKIIPENSGDYSCQAMNPISKMTGETTLEIDMIATARKCPLVLSV